jgi:hypothetical protein
VSTVSQKIREIDGVNAERVIEQVALETEPVVFRGLVSDWPLVRKSSESIRDVRRFLLRYYRDAPVRAFTLDAEHGGRIFYTDDFSATNFKQIRTGLDWVLAQIDERKDDTEAPTVYMGSTEIDSCLPGLREQNSLPLGDKRATVRIWMGNRSTVAAHYDVLENIACVGAGRRRFTVFPPDQLANLYVGPIDFTPAGQAISLVDLNDPDFEKYPRFAEALEHAQTAELEPGDAIYIPGMWWHQVEGLESLNILINHWWKESPPYMRAPGDALLHAILCIRDLPEEQRNAWRVFFEHYVFAADDQTADHIPTGKRGALGGLDEEAAEKIRATLSERLNR